MSEYADPVGPPSPAPRPAPPARPASSGISCLGVAFTLSLLLNLASVAVILLACGSLLLSRGDMPPPPLPDRYHSGNANANNKVAVVEVEGVIIEGALDYVHKQIDTAARDKDVKAVVVRVNSPGGSITASDDLHHRLSELRDGSARKKTNAKPIVVSMGSLAASGGYYISMPGKPIYAEKTTLTGSIGVYISFPNLAKISDKYGFKMELIKRGNVKDSGSMFKEMTDEERQVWQEMVDDAYGQFKSVVEVGRPELKGKLEEYVVDRQMTAEKKGPDGKVIQEAFRYRRQRADGGVFTADKAKEYGLVDKIGYLEDAIEEAATKAGVSDYKAVNYDRPLSLGGLLGAQSGEAEAETLAGPLSNALTPRLWFLAPQSELAGFTAALRR